MLKKAAEQAVRSAAFFTAGLFRLRGRRAGTGTMRTHRSKRSADKRGPGGNFAPCPEASRAARCPEGAPVCPCLVKKDIPVSRPTAADGVPGAKPSEESWLRVCTAEDAAASPHIRRPSACNLVKKVYFKSVCTGAAIRISRKSFTGQLDRLYL